jgi:hypothetical protein
LLVSWLWLPSLQRWSQLRLWQDEVSNEKSTIVSKEVKTIPSVIDRIVRNHAQVDIIQFIRVRLDFFVASNEIKGGSRDPVNVPHHPTAVGVSSLMDSHFKVLQFYEITAARRGYGEKMVAAVLDGVPQDWEVCIVIDWSGGFWRKMKEKYPNVNRNFL